MVRKDDLDFGLWGEIPASKLVIPVDTHIAQISKYLKLTKKHSLNHIS
jgi:endonuclease III